MEASGGFIPVCGGPYDGALALAAPGQFRWLTAWHHGFAMAWPDPPPSGRGALYFCTGEAYEHRGTGAYQCAGCGAYIDQDARGLAPRACPLCGRARDGARVG